VGKKRGGGSVGEKLGLEKRKKDWDLGKGDTLGLREKRGGVIMKSSTDYKN